MKYPPSACNVLSNRLMILIFWRINMSMSDRDCKSYFGYTFVISCNLNDIHFEGGYRAIIELVKCVQKVYFNPIKHT